MLAELTVYKQPGAASLNITDMVAQVFRRIDELDPRRKYLYVEWLIAHCKMKQDENLHYGLIVWLSGLPQDDLACQQRLILMEIDWWLAQSAATIERLMREHFAGRRS